jgi:hypothetical protein
MSDIFQNFNFGIEFESCVNIGDTVFGLRDDYRKIRQQVHDSILKGFQDKKIEEKNPLNTVQWQFYDTYAKYTNDYTKWWYITNDGSIYCNEDSKYCILKGQRSEICPDVSFCDIEIVSKILKTKDYQGFKELVFAWIAYILSDNLTYLVNDTQGLHVHISHPDLDLYKFLKVWFIYEPVINNIISPYRRKNKNDKQGFCTDIRCLTDYKSLQTKSPIQTKKGYNIDLKYYAINTKFFQEYEKRVEIRVYQGTADIEEIYNWVLFCLTLAKFSIQNIDDVLDTIYEKFQDDYAGLLISLFQNVIVDKNLVDYFLTKHNENKTEDTPIAKQNFDTQIIYPTWDKILDQESLNIAKKLQAMKIEYLPVSEQD